MRYKKSAYRYLDKRGETLDAPFTADFFGLSYEGNLSNGIEFAIYYYGAFEKPLLFFLRDTAQQLAAISGEPIGFCDIGSNVGQHALFMSGHAKRVDAFEPFSPVRNKLEHHIQLNNITNIHVHPVGLGSQNGELTFYAPTGSNQGVGSFIEQGNDQRTQVYDQLRVVRGDDYFAEEELAPVHLIKMDVEGFERNALLGLQQTLQANRPVIALEVTYGEAQSFSSLADLKAALPPDYSYYYFDTRKADGSTARRRGSRAKRTGKYQLVPLNAWRDTGQDDIVAVPQEFLQFLPLSPR